MVLGRPHIANWNYTCTVSLSPNALKRRLVSEGARSYYAVLILWYGLARDVVTNVMSKRLVGFRDPSVRVDETRKPRLLDFEVTTCLYI